MIKKNIHRKLILLLLISFIVIMLIYTWISIFRLYALPYGCNHLDITNGIAKIDKYGSIKWADGRQHATIFYDDTISKIREIAAVVRTLNLTKTNELPTDVQLIEISFTRFTDTSKDKLWTTYVAYDFYTQKLYANKDGVWYLMKDNERLNTYIIERLTGDFMFPWRGQSTYSREEFTESDFENATFRYNLYWTVFPMYAKKIDIQLTNFNNTDEKPIPSREDAILRAAQELGYDNPVAIALYDETCNYYMVEIANNNGDGIMKNINGTMRLIEPIYTVIIDDKGKTVEIYLGVTRTRPFWS